LWGVALPGFQLQFRLGPSLQGRPVSLHTNYPSAGRGFERTCFRVLDWVKPTGGRDDDSDKFCCLDLQLAGSFHFHYSLGYRDAVAMTNTPHTHSSTTASGTGMLSL